MWILWMTSSLSSHSTSASVSELSRLVTHTAVSSPKCNSEKRPLSNGVVLRTLFKWHRYCGILKIHIVRKINTGIRYEPVYRPALRLLDVLMPVNQRFAENSRAIKLFNSGNKLFKMSQYLLTFPKPYKFQTSNFLTFKKIILNLRCFCLGIHHSLFFLTSCTVLLLYVLWKVLFK